MDLSLLRNLRSYFGKPLVVQSWRSHLTKLALHGLATASLTDHANSDSRAIVFKVRGHF
jgi:hypothetical protein